MFILPYNVLSCLFQRVMELEAAVEHHDFIYIKEVGFNTPPYPGRGLRARYLAQTQSAPPECSSPCWGRNGLMARSRGGGGMLKDCRENEGKVV